MGDAADCLSASLVQAAPFSLGGGHDFTSLCLGEGTVTRLLSELPTPPGVWLHLGLSLKEHQCGGRLLRSELGFPSYVNEILLSGCDSTRCHSDGAF